MGDLPQFHLSRLQVLNGGLYERAGQKNRGDGNHLARRLPRPSATGRPVGIKGLDLVSDPYGFRHAVGAADHTDANLVWFSSPSEGSAVQRIDPDEIKSGFRRLNAS
jgi:hypothetical protein